MLKTATYLVLFFLILPGFISAQETVIESELTFAEDLAIYNGKPFTGIADHWVNLSEKAGKPWIKRKSAFKNGKIHGWQIDYNAKGLITAKHTFKENKKTRTSEFQYHGATPFPLKQQSYAFEDGVKIPHGKWADWYPDGTQRSERHYKMDQLQGVYSNWFQDGTLQSKVNYNKGLKNGTAEYFWPDGKVSGESIFKEGKLHGNKKSWNRAGILTMDAEFKSGFLHGNRRIWYEDGTARSIEQIENNQLNGSAEYYYPNGKLELKGSFKAGEKNGFWQHFRVDGAMDSEGKYWANDRQGEWTLWTCSGALVKVKYENGKMEYLSDNLLPDQIEELGKSKIKGLAKGEIRVTGKVFSKKDCALLAGETLLLQSKDETLAETTTDENGEYSFDFVPEKDLRISTLNGKFVAVSVFDFRVKAGFALGLNFYLTAPSCEKAK